MSNAPEHDRSIATHGLNRREKVVLGILADAYPDRIFKRQIAERLPNETYAAHPRAWTEVALGPLKAAGLVESTKDGFRATGHGLHEASRPTT